MESCAPIGNIGNRRCAAQATGAHGRFGIVLREYGLRWLKAGLSLQPSSEYPSRVKEPVDAVCHLFVVYDVAAIRGCGPPVHAFDKVRLPVRHAGNGFGHHLCGGFAFARGKLFN